MKNVTLNADAKVLNTENVEIGAKDFVCENKEIIFVGLEATKAMVKNPILKTIIATIVNLVEHIIEKNCK